MRFLVLNFVLLVCATAGLSFAHAGDEVEWDDYSIYTDYDSSDQELEIKFTVYSDGAPDEDYELEMEVWDERCEMELEYKSFQLTGECVVGIDEEDVRWIYKTSLEVVSMQTNNEEYSDTSVEFEIDGFEEEFDWDELQVDASYDADDEDLELKIYLENITREPDYDYEIEFEIDDKWFTKKFKYDEDESELSFSFDTPVDEDDIEDEYEIEYEVFNTDLDDEEVGDWDVEFDVNITGTNDDFDWDKLEYTAIYDEDRERLALTLYLDDISDEPSKTYESFIELDQEEYDEKFNYDEDENKLIAEYSIKIDEDDLDYYYDIELIIEDEDSDEVYDDEIDVDVEYLSEADDFDWDELEVSASYNENKEILYIELVLENITSTPLYSYITELEFADEEEFKKFTYYKDEDELRASIEVRVDEEDIEEEYEFDIEIENDDQERVYNEDIDVEVSDYKELAQEADADYTWKDTTVKFNYTTTSQYLIIEVELLWVNDYPSLDYFAELNVSWLDDELDSKLRYDSSGDRLYALFNVFMRETDIEDEYNLTMFINDEYGDLQHLLTESIDVIFDKADEVEENIEDKRYVAAATVNAIESFKNRTYKKYDTRNEALDYFAYVIVALDAYADKKTRYRSVVDDINYLLQLEIDKG